MTTGPADTPSQLRNERIRANGRKLLGSGAIVGLAIGLLAQPFIGQADLGDVEWLVRLAMLLPTILYVAWWLLFPGVHEPEVAAPAATIDPQQRLEHIESTFDAAAVPRVRRNRIEASDSQAPFLRASIGRDDSELPTPASFGIPRPPLADVEPDRHAR